MRAAEHGACHRHEQLPEELRQIVLDEIAEARVNVDAVELRSGDEEVVRLGIAVQAGPWELPTVEASALLVEAFDRGPHRMLRRQAPRSSTKTFAFLLEIGGPLVAGHRAVVRSEPQADLLEEPILLLFTGETQDPGRRLRVGILHDDRRAMKRERTRHPEAGLRVGALEQLTRERELFRRDPLGFRGALGAERLQERARTANAAHGERRRGVVPAPGRSHPPAPGPAIAASENRSGIGQAGILHRGRTTSKRGACPFRFSRSCELALRQRAVRRKKTFVSMSRMNTSPFISGTYAKRP